MFSDSDIGKKKLDVATGTELLKVVADVMDLPNDEIHRLKQIWDVTEIPRLLRPQCRSYPKYISESNVQYIRHYCG